VTAVQVTVIDTLTAAPPTVVTLHEPTPSSVQEIGSDLTPSSGTKRGPSPVINTDGERGDRIFVGDARPELLGAVPIPGDVYIGDPPSGDVRPPAGDYGVGGEFYDTSLHKPIWSDGTIWRDAMGTPV